MCIRWTMVAAVLAATVAGGAGATDEPQQALRVVAAVDVGGAPSGMVVADGDLWVSLAVDGVVRIDQATNTVVARIDRPMVGLAAGYGSVWGIDVFRDVLLQIDPGTNRITREIPVGEMPTGIAAGFGSVWVANTLDGTVTRVDPVSGEAIATIPLGTGPIWPGRNRRRSARDLARLRGRQRRQQNRSDEVPRRRAVPAARRPLPCRHGGHHLGRPGEE